MALEQQDGRVRYTTRQEPEFCEIKLRGDETLTSITAYKRRNFQI
jgi:hypothetical protein